MSGTYLEGDRALERLGDLTELICIEAQKMGLDKDNLLLDSLLEQMSEALKNRDIKKARELVVSMLADVLGYESQRARFVMQNHLNKNAGWD